MRPGNVPSSHQESSHPAAHATDAGWAQGRRFGRVSGRREDRELRKLRCVKMISYLLRVTSFVELLRRRGSHVCSLRVSRVSSPRLAVCGLRVRVFLRLGCESSKGGTVSSFMSVFPSLSTNSGGKTDT